MRVQSKEASRHVDAVLSALDILDCFQGTSSLTLKEVIDATGLTRSRAMRLIGTLESRGYLAANPDSKTYHPGVKLPVLAKSFEKINQVEILIRPVLKQLALDTGESASLYVLDGIERVVLAHEEGSHPIRYAIQEGQRHLLCRGGAASKVLLSFGPKDWLEAVSSGQPNETTAFIKGLEMTRKQGYAISFGENSPDVHSISSPVFNSSHKLVGALAISGPLSRLGTEQIEKLLPLIVASAQHLSQRI